MFPQNIYSLSEWQQMLIYGPNFCVAAVAFYSTIRHATFVIKFVVCIAYSTTNFNLLTVSNGGKPQKVKVLLVFDAHIAQAAACPLTRFRYISKWLMMFVYLYYYGTVNPLSDKQ